MQFKDECEPGFSYWTVKTASGVLKVTSSLWPLLYGHLSNKNTFLCPFGARSREVRLYSWNKEKWFVFYFLKKAFFSR